jgi:hypothetical protein
VSGLKGDRSNLAEWLGWEVVRTDPEVECFSFRWRDEKTEHWHTRAATALEVQQFDQVRALAFSDLEPASGPAISWFLGKMKEKMAADVRELLMAEVNRSVLVESRDGKAQRLGSVLALNAVLHLLGEPQVPVEQVVRENPEQNGLRVGEGRGGPAVVVRVSLLLQALAYWTSERTASRHPSGSRPADRQTGELVGLAIAKGVVLALEKGENPFARDAVEPVL